jgi:hypothetical protein
LPNAPVEIVKSRSTNPSDQDILYIITELQVGCLLAGVGDRP